MTTTDEKPSKIINPQMSRGLLQGKQQHGEFEVYIRLSQPEKLPAGMKVTSRVAPGFFKATIPSRALDSIAQDRNVVDIELRAFNSHPDTTLVQ